MSALILVLCDLRLAQVALAEITSRAQGLKVVHFGRTSSFPGNDVIDVKLDPHIAGRRDAAMPTTEPISPHHQMAKPPGGFPWSTRGPTGGFSSVYVGWSTLSRNDRIA